MIGWSVVERRGDGRWSNGEENNGDDWWSSGEEEMIGGVRRFSGVDFSFFFLFFAEDLTQRGRRGEGVALFSGDPFGTGPNRSQKVWAPVPEGLGPNPSPQIGRSHL